MISAIQTFLNNIIFLIRTLLWKLQITAEDYLVEKSPGLKECYRLLNLTSQTFAAIIPSTPAEIRNPICLFYLVLRGLDTIEDDMTIDIKEKEPLLRNFHKVLEDENWTYNGNGPEEKDRELLVKFDVVTKEFKKIKKDYQIIIKDVVKEMGDGMADFAKKAGQGIQTVQEYEMYCHVAAGIGLEGITRMFVEARAADPALLNKPEVIRAASQYLQQAGIIRDIREDHEEHRHFLPKEVWRKYVDTFPEIFHPENKEKALYCLSEMILLDLRNVKLGLLFLKGFKEGCAIQSMAFSLVGYIVHLELFFQNYAVFERTVKISKKDAIVLMARIRNFRGVCEVFRESVRKIRRKNRPQDPHFVSINDVCNEIEKYIESEFPSQTDLHGKRLDDRMNSSVEFVCSKSYENKENSFVFESQILGERKTQERRI